MESCRVCMGSTEVVVDMFADRPLHEYEMTLSDMINEIVDFKVQRNELPQKICISCSLNAQIAFRFKRSCERSHYLLTSKMLSKSNSTVDLGDSDVDDADSIEPIQHTMLQQMYERADSLSCRPGMNSSKDHIEKEQKEQQPVINKIKNKESSSIDGNTSSGIEEHNRSAARVRTQEMESDEAEWERHFVDEKRSYSPKHGQGKPFAANDAILKREPSSTEDDNSYIFHQDTSKTYEDSDNIFNSASNDSDYGANIDTDSIASSTKNSSDVQGFTNKIHIPRRKIGQSKIGFYKCPFCGRAFNNSGNLRNHMFTHTKERPYKCDQCQAAFSRRDKLNVHKRIHFDERKYKCPQCPRSFVVNSALQKHLTIHSSEQSPMAITVNSNLQYKCPQCPRSYSHNSALLRHLEFHSDEHPYKCEDCAMPFANKCTLQLHSRIHTGERPFKCSQCPKAFFAKSKLETHVLSHTGERPYRCQDCDRGFVTASNLKRHSINIHNNIY